MNEEENTTELMTEDKSVEITDDMLGDVSGGEDTVRYIKGINRCLSCTEKIVWNQERGSYWCPHCKKLAFAKARSSL
ncbi:MAG: hypothetical protein LUD16_05190 [Lachnospiraceae bacterium]|nr:hypothetical protein [Lachnospiraceae bacterium]